MKKLFFAIVLVVSMTVMLHAQETGVSGSPSSGLDWDIRFGISLPFISNFSSFPDKDDVPFETIAPMWFALAFSSVSLGGGVQYTVIPHFIAPGIYADVHFNFFSWFIAGVFSDWKYNFMLLQPEIRAYNQFQFTKSFGFEPFFGINYMYIRITNNFRETIPLMNAGFVLKFGNSFGFEYSYNFSGKPLEDGWTPRIHRIGLSWSFRNHD